MSLSTTVLIGDAEETLRTLPEASVDCCITSPPYFNLRNYNDLPNQIGLEKTVDAYVDQIVSVFRETRRVLKPEATLWINLGDKYIARNLLGIPWEVAFALKREGYRLRSEVIWHKPNALPGGGPRADKPERCHEHLFFFSCSDHYYWDDAAAQVPAKEPHRKRSDRFGGKNGHLVRHSEGGMSYGHTTRRLRSVWEINTRGYPGAHFSTFPEELVEPCVKTSCPSGGVVLDPFAGTGTVGMVAQKHGRSSILIDLDPACEEMIRARISSDSVKETV